MEYQRSTRRLEPSNSKYALQKQKAINRSVMMAAALGLGACRGPEDSTEPTTTTVSGFAIKGPLNNFRVFYDDNLNGVYDQGERFAMTNSDGGFTIKFRGNHTLVGEVTGSTVDAASGRKIDGYFMETKSGATVISPITTVLNQTDQKGAGFQEFLSITLRLPEVDLYNYNPYDAANINTAAARDVEQISQQLANITRALTGLGEGAGLDARPAFDIASDALNTALAQQVAPPWDNRIDLWGDVTIGAVMTAYRAGLEAAGHSTSVFDAMREEMASAIDIVNQRILAVGNLTSTEARAVFGLPSDLYAQVKAAAIAIENGQANPGLSLDTWAGLEQQLAENGFTPPAPPAPPAPAGPAPVLTVNNNLTVLSDINATLEVTGGGVLGNLLAGQAFTLTQQGTVTTGTLFARANGQTSTVSAQTFTLGTAGNETIDTTSAGNRVDFVFGGDGDDYIFTGGGNDHLIGGDGYDTLDGGAGDDVITGGASMDMLTGGLGNDQFIIDAGDDMIFDLATGDSVFVLPGATVTATDVTAFIATADTENLGSVAADFVVVAAAAGSTIDIDLATVASASTDGFTLTGGVGADIITGSDGDDVINGNAGDDTISGGAGADTLTGGGGSDTVSYADITLSSSHGLANIAGMAVNLSGVNVTAATIAAAIGGGVVMGGGAAVAGADLAAGTAGYLATSAAISTTTMVRDTLTGFEAVTGSALGDIIALGAGGMSANGGAGDDSILGGTGADTIDGGAGEDIISGGAGADTLTGGLGADTFALVEGDSVAYTAATLSANVTAGNTITFGNGVDVITDFTAGGGGDILAGVDAAAAPTTGIGVAIANGFKDDTFFLSGAFDQTTGVFTVTADGAGADTMILDVQNHGANALSAVDGIVILIGVDSADLIASNFIM